MSFYWSDSNITIPEHTETLIVSNKFTGEICPDIIPDTVTNISMANVKHILVHSRFLPSNLKKLILCNYELYDLDANNNIILPESLSELDFGTCLYFPLDRLPRFLTKLKMSDNIFGNIHFSVFPETLTDLDLGIMLNSTIVDHSLPINLERLKMGVGAFTPHRDIFPDSLRHLDIGHLECNITKDSLPSYLTSIVIGYNYDFINNIKSYAENLQELELTETCGCYLNIDNIPGTLRKLRINDTCGPQCNIGILPDSVEYLALGCKYFLNPSGAHIVMPPMLKYLEINNINQLQCIATSKFLFPSLHIIYGKKIDFPVDVPFALLYPINKSYSRSLKNVGTTMIGSLEYSILINPETFQSRPSYLTKSAKK